MAEGGAVTVTPRPPSAAVSPVTLALQYQTIGTRGTAHSLHHLGYDIHTLVRKCIFT